MKKKTKRNYNYKKLSVIGLIVTVFILTIWLIIAVVGTKKDLNSEILSLKQIKLADYKEDNRILGSYKVYKEFLKENNVEGNLTKKDFKRADYILITETYASKYEKEMKKFSQLSMSDVNGLLLQFEAYAYCDDIDTVELIAYLIPVSKSNNIIGSDIKVEYNYIEGTKCKEEE